VRDLTGTTIENRYALKSHLAHGGAGNVYRARDNSTGAEIAVKMIDARSSSQGIDDIIHFHNEIDTVLKINNPHVIKIHHWGTVADETGPQLYFIIMDLVNGKGLDRVLAGGKDLSHDDAIGLLIQICGGLTAVHGSGVIHGDLKPGNIIIGPDRQAVIIDFGLANLKNTPLAFQPGTVSGTFMYLSPEQAGLIRQDVDERSDLYSMGVIAYEMLTGGLPFRGESLIGLLHQQAARVPVAPSRHNKDIPPALDEIIMTLLEKEPRNRYQTAQGLLHDLEQVKSGVANFRPHQKDSARSIDFNTPLFGRAPELSLLNDRLETLHSGHGGLCLIGGGPGTGKSRLLQEFRKTVLGSGTVYVEATASPGKSRSPYFLFKEVLGSYMRRFAAYSKEKQSEITEKIRNRCSDQGHVVTRFYPPLEKIIGPCPSPVSLEPEQERQRFLITLCRFYVTLAGIENGIVIGFEDVHWADEGSLMLLNRLCSEAAGSPLLITATYRSTELDTESVRKTLGIPGHRPTETAVLMLQPLSSEAVTQLIGALFSQEFGQINKLCSHVYEKSGGNPLHALEMIRGLVEKGILANKDGSWVLDENELLQVEPLSSSVEVIIARIRQSDKNLRELLSTASVMGKEFEIPLLMELLKTQRCTKKQTAGKYNDEGKLISLLDQARQQHYITYKTESRETVSFTHDRVRDAFHQRLNKKERSRLHHDLAHLLELQSRRTGEENIFSIAAHFIEAGNDEKIIQYGYAAGIRAQLNFDHSDAIRYFETVLSITKKHEDEKKFPGVKEIIIDCLLYLGESYQVIGHNRKATEILAELTLYEMSSEKKIRLFYLLSKSFFNEGDFIFAEKYAIRGLQLLGGDVPDAGHPDAMRILKRIKTLFMKSHRERIPLSPEDGRYPGAIWFYLILYNIYSFQDSRRCGHIMRSIVAAARSRNSGPRETALALSVIGSRKIHAMNYRGMRSCEKKSTRLTKTVPDKWAVASITTTIGRCDLFSGRYERAREFLHQGAKLFKKFEDARELMLANFYLSLASYHSSDYAAARDYFEKSRRKVSTIFDDVFIHAWGYPAYRDMETGDFGKAEETLVRYLALLRGMKFWHLYFYNLLLIANLNTEKGDYRRARSFFHKAAELLEEHDIPLFFRSPLCLFRARFLIATYNSCETEQGIREKKSLLKKIRKECSRALSCCSIENRGAALRLMARYQVLKNRNKKAASLFEKSARHDRSLNRNYELARTLYEYALFLKKNGDSEKAYRNFLESYHLFSGSGALSWAKKISSIISSDEQKNRTCRQQLYNARISHVTELTTRLGAIHDEEELFNAILYNAMEVTGARQGNLFFFDDRTDRLECVASAAIDESINADYSMNIVNTVFETGNSLLTANAETDKDLMDFQSVSQQNLKSILCVPMQHNEITNGVCWLDNPLATGVFGDEEKNVVEFLLSQSVFIVENLFLHKRLNEFETQKATVGPVPSPSLDNLLETTMQYIEEHYAEEVTRADIADDLGINPDYLGKHFKSSTGKTIKDHLNSVRIKKAVSMLDADDMKIIDIAFAVGFESLRTFNRVFYRIMGCSPGEYREKQAS